MRSRVQLAALAAVLALGAGAATAEPMPVKFTQVYDGQFKGRQKVGIATYHINFVTSQQATAVATIGARTRLAMVLAGVDEATMRRLTDEAHADLRAQFEAAGVPVLSDAEMQAMVAEAGIQVLPGNVDKGGGGPGITIGKSLKRGYVTYGPQAAPALAPMRTMGGPMTMGAPLMAMGKFAKPAFEKDANIVAPSMTIDFAEMSADTGSDFLGRAKASASGDVAFMIKLDSQTTTFNPANGGRGGTPGGLRLTKNVVSSTEFARVEEGGAPVRVGSMTAIADDNYQMVARARGDAVVVNKPVWEGLVRDAYRGYNAAIVAAVLKVIRK